LDDQSVLRLRAAGREWGLAESHVDALIRRYTQANLRRQRKEQQTTALALGAAGVISVGLLGFLVWTLLGGRSDRQRRVADQPVAANRNALASADRVPNEQQAAAVTPPKWWDTTLAVAMVRARASVPAFTPYVQLASDDPTDRATGYEQLQQLCRRARDRADHLHLFAEIISGCHALEENEANAEQLRSGLLALLAVSGDDLPHSELDYEFTLWATRTAVAALYREGLSDVRADALSAALGRTLGIAVDRQLARSETQRQCFAAVVQSLYGQLTTAGPSQPQLAIQLHQHLAYVAARTLKIDDMERLEADFLVAVLPKAPDAWPQLAALIQRSVASKDPLNVLKMVDLYQRSVDPDLQRFMAESLIFRVDAEPASMAVADVARAVREALGASASAAPSTARERWQLLQALADEALAGRSTAPGAAKDEPDTPLLTEVLDLAYLATLACALAQQEPGFPLFDQLRAEGSPKMSDDAKAAGDVVGGGRLERSPSVARPIRLNDQKEDLERHLTNLASYRTPTAMRPNYLRHLARLTDSIDELEPAQGATIARYLLTHKNDDELRQTLEPARQVFRWKYVGLALADQLADAKLSPVQMQQLLSELLQRDVNLEEVNRRDTIRAELLRGVLFDLSSLSASVALSPGGAPQIFDRASKELHQLYQTRARAVGVTPGDYKATASPAEAIQLLVAYDAAQLSSGSLRPADEQYLTRLPHEVAVVNYLGENDVRRTVLLQRVWLRLLGMGIARRRADCSSQATALLTALNQRDVAATDLLAQLKDGEATTLKMWMLYAP
jgi:hypothetical protein